MAAKQEQGRRALAKERRRQQLIDATIKCISRKGLGSTTLADVAKDAGLSQGIVNLHFNSKENLLAETLRFVAEDYDVQFMQILQTPASSPAKTLLALMELDLSPAICERKKLAVWFAFWGEVKAVPTYQKICAARERKYDNVMLELTQAVIDAGRYANIDAQVTADTLSALTTGLWLSCLVSPEKFDRDAARKTVSSYLQAVFPKHYP